ncbi:hypothetical protein Hanom_Chr05g00392791 [Helianthus anomalus]
MNLYPYMSKCICDMIVAYCGRFHIQMAPKESKQKPAKKKENKTEEEIMSEKRHNQIAYLDVEGKLAELKDITIWIRDSRINYAVTFSTLCCASGC